MTPDLHALATQLAADLATLHRAGRIASAWRVGMKIADAGDLRVMRLRTHEPTDRGCGYVEADTAEVYACDGHVPCPVCNADEFSGLEPDLSDEATVDGVVRLAREALGDPRLHLASYVTHDFERGRTVEVVWWRACEGHGAPLVLHRHEGGGVTWCAGPSEALAACAAIRAAAAGVTP